MSNLMINKLKHIDNSRKDLQVILENKGIDLTNSSKSLDSLISNVAQLNLHDNVNPDTWEGVTKQDDPGKYWKGDEDWKNLIDIDAIMEADTNDYQGKVFFLIRCSDNEALDEYPTGYTNRAIVGLQAFRFSDSGMDELATTTEHHFNKDMDIVAPNGERFRWIIGYTNSTTAVMLWQSKYLIPEAVVYWSGTFRGICFEDAAPYYTGSGSSINYTWSYAYDNGSGGYSYYTSFSLTNYNASYLGCVAPRYFEVKEDVVTQFVTGDYESRYNYSKVNDRTRTIIVDGTVVCEFVRNGARNCKYVRFSKPGCKRYMTLSTYGGTPWDDISPERAYVYADVSACEGTVWCAVSNGYVELHGDMNTGTLQFNKMFNSSIITDNVFTLAGAEGSANCDFEFKVIQGGVNDRAFMDCTGHLKFDYIERNVGYWAFRNFRNIPTEIIFKKKEGYTGTHSLGYGAFYNTNIEKIDMSDSAITALNVVGKDPEAATSTNSEQGYDVRQAFYGAPRLKIIHLPKNMTSIPAYALSRLASVTTVTLPENLTTVGDYAFYDCPILTTISSFPDTLQSVGRYAFAECRNLEQLDFSAATLMTVMQERVCAGCTMLQKVLLPPKLGTIYSAAFASCYNLERIALPNTVTGWSEYAFEYCYKLRSITYEDPTVGELKYVGAYSLQACFSLQELVDLNFVIDGMGSNGSVSDHCYHPFMDCRSMTFTLLANRPVNLSDSYYYAYFYRFTGAKLLVPEDYAYTGTLQLYGADWCLRNFLDFIQSVPDRTGSTATKFALGCDYRVSSYSYSNNGSGTQAYSIYPTVYSKYYVKEIDGVLEGSTTQEDDTWVLVSDYVAAKNCTLS